MTDGIPTGAAIWVRPVCSQCRTGVMSPYERRRDSVAVFVSVSREQ